MSIKPFSTICTSINVHLSHSRPQSPSNMQRAERPSTGRAHLPSVSFTTTFSCPFFPMHEICSETWLEFMMSPYTSPESLLKNLFRLSTTPARRGVLPAGQRSPRLPHFEYNGTILRSCVYQILITLDTANITPPARKNCSIHVSRVLSPRFQYLPRIPRPRLKRPGKACHRGAVRQAWYHTSAGLDRYFHNQPVVLLACPTCHRDPRNQRYPR